MARRYGCATTLALVLAMLFTLVGCDYGDSPPQTASLEPNQGDPSAMVQAILDASESVSRFMPS